jgi:hypothetical protein
MKRSGMKDPSYYEKKSSGFFATLRMTQGYTLTTPTIDTFNGRSNNNLLHGLKLLVNAALTVWSLSISLFFPRLQAFFIFLPDRSDPLSSNKNQTNSTVNTCVP